MNEVISTVLGMVCDLLLTNRKTAPYALVLLVLMLIGVTVYFLMGS